MKEKLTGPMAQNYSKGEIVFTAGEKESDLYIIHSGKVMVFVLKGSQVTPVAYLSAGEYLGELSLFDQDPRSASVLSVEDSTLIKIPLAEIDKQFPHWLLRIAKSMTKQIRELDEIVRAQGIRKQNVDTIKPLSIGEQTQFYKTYSEYIKKRSEEAQSES